MNELRQRDIPHRDKKLRDSARDKPCLYHTSGSCDERTVVWCHSNQSRHGKGGARKAHDCFGFYGCSVANAPTSLPRKLREAAEDRAMHMTRAYMILQGVIVGATTRDGRDDERWLEGWRSGRIKVV